MVDTSVTIFGNLTRDPDLTVTGTTPRCNFRLASTERRWDRAAGEYVDGHTVFISVTCWRSLAEHVAGSVSKGDAVVVVGRLRQRSYVNDKEVAVSVTEIDADMVGVDLRRGITRRLNQRRPLRLAGPDENFDTARSDDAVRPDDAMTGSDDSEAMVSDSELRSLVTGEPQPELVSAATEPPF